MIGHARESSNLAGIGFTVCQQPDFGSQQKKHQTRQDCVENYSTIHICVSIKVHGAIFHVVLILLEETCSRTANPKQYDNRS